jgi:putative N6-adenine-specific DNA methylase
LIEAAMIAKGIPPGIYRKSFGFERWPDFDQNLFEEIYNREYEKEFNGKVIGSDISVMNISIAKANIKNAGLSKSIEVFVQDVRKLDPPFENGIIITNPPYGERIKPQSIEDLYTEMGNVLKRKFSGYEAWVLSGSVEGLKSIGLKPTRKLELFNGSIPCSFRCYNLFQGTRKKLLVIKKTN